MNQEKIQDWDTNKFFCETHNECQLQFLYFGETPKLKSRLLCESCIIEVFNAEERQPSLLFLKDFLSNPENQLMKITKINDYQNQGNESELIEKIEELLQQFQDSVKIQAELIRQNLHQLQTLLGTIASEVKNKFELNNIVESFKLLAQMDSYQGTNELIQLEDQLTYISDNLSNSYIEVQKKVKDNQMLIINNFKNNFKQIQIQYDQVFKSSLDLILKIGYLSVPDILNDDLGEFPQIHQQISQGKLIEYQLIYQGTRDGLNGQSYWAKCNNQSNLLTIMTSKNGNRFGGYSPCQVKSAINTHVKDPTMKSFLFQYNKKEIYKIKNQDHAVYCSPSYGPCFGNNCDITINPDFNSGCSSYIGQTYDISSYNIVDKATHIFGALDPQLKECKVYKVIF